MLQSTLELKEGRSCGEDYKSLLLNYFEGLDRASEQYLTCFIFTAIEWLRSDDCNSSVPSDSITNILNKMILAAERAPSVLQVDVCPDYDQRYIDDEWMRSVTSAYDVLAANTSHQQSLRRLAHTWERAHHTGGLHEPSWDHPDKVLHDCLHRVHSDGTCEAKECPWVSHNCFQDDFKDDAHSDDDAEDRYCPGLRRSCKLLVKCTPGFLPKHLRFLENKPESLSITSPISFPVPLPHHTVHLQNDPVVTSVPFARSLEDESLEDEPIAGKTQVAASTPPKAEIGQPATGARGSTEVVPGHTYPDVPPLLNGDRDYPVLRALAMQSIGARAGEERTQS